MNISSTKGITEKDMFAKSLCFISLVVMFGACQLGEEVEVAAVSSAVTTTFGAGTCDAFALPTEPVSPSATLVSALGSPPICPFDSTQINCIVAHTFSNLPANLCAASITIPARATAELTRTDQLTLMVANSPAGLPPIPQQRWMRFIGPAFGDPGLVPQWNPGNSATFTLDLTNLPCPIGTPTCPTGNIDLLPAINTYGFLDATVADDTAADCMRLTVTVCDSDGDGIPDDQDLCPDTAQSDTAAGVPEIELGVNRWADIDGDGVFDTNLPNGHGPRLSFTMEDTQGCNCAQIISELELGHGHSRFGCSISAMRDWVMYVDP
jgi:hypothetical protein